MAQKKKTQPEIDFGVPGLAGMMTALNPVASKAWVDLMSESSEFVTERLNSTVTLQQKLMASRNPAEMVELQTAYIKETMEACSAEMSRYATLMMSSAGDIAKDAKTGHKRGYDDVPV